MPDKVSLTPPPSVYGRAGCIPVSCPPPAVWTCRVSHQSQAAWTCRVPIHHHQHYGPAGCLTSHKQYGRAGCLSTTTSSMVVQGVSPPPPAVRTCWVYAFTPWYSFCKCRTVRHPVSPISEWKRIQMPEPVRYRNKGTQSGMFWYRTETSNTVMPMLMPGFNKEKTYRLMPLHSSLSHCHWTIPLKTRIQCLIRYL